MDEQEQWLVLGSILGLAVCVMLHGTAIARLNRDVEFVTVLAEKRIDV